MDGIYQSGIAIVNPPGEHTETHSSHGFCIGNNVALAAKYARKCRGIKRYFFGYLCGNTVHLTHILFISRVLILDWNIHRDGATQKIFDVDKKVLYISFYHCENSDLSTESMTGNCITVNIPWNKHEMSDYDYIAVFQRIIMPIAYEFDPELVLVSVGFDSITDYHATPAAYGYFTHWLSSLANGKIIVCFEGGYSSDSICATMTICAKALLGDPLPILSTCEKALNASCVESIQYVSAVYQEHYKCLKFGKKLPSFDVISRDSK